MGIVEGIIENEKVTNIKEQVENYWTKRADGFLELREAELHSNKYDRWEKEILYQLKEYELRLKKHNGAELKNQLRILDIGCGCGFFGIILARNGYKVTGIDLTPAMIERGKEFAIKHKCTMELLVMDAEKLEFEDDTFDVIISRNLTWTLPHIKEAYKEWRRVLKTGGLLLNYDAEYSKSYKKQDELPKEHAHCNISSQLKQQCHDIYNMLPSNTYSRPDWDRITLKEIGMNQINIKENAAKEIYIEKDKFYIADPIFRISAYK